MNVDKIREDFPVLQKHTYLDSACMSLKPKQVVEAMNEYFYEFPACGERSSHKLGKRVTEEVETARKKIAKFVGAKPEEIVFTKNTTEGLNLAANALKLEKNDTVVTSDKEHNSNLLPWLKFNHDFVNTKSGQLDLDLPKAEVVSLVHTSNIDGVSFPVKELGKIAHDNGSVFVVDGAQSAPHKEIDVKKLNCDIFAFSGHKMLGPSIGAVYVSKDLDLDNFLVGGGTVANVNDGKPTFLPIPEAFEAGLQNYAGIIGFRAAVEYLEKIGMKNIEKHEAGLNKLATEQISQIEKVSILHESQDRSGIISMIIEGVKSTEASLMFDSHGVLLRGGHHCCHNWFNKNKLDGTVRASLYLYNNQSDVEKLIEAAKKVAQLG